MTRAVLLACLPWLELLAALLLVAWLLVRLNASPVGWRRLRRLHSEEDGSAQSLSFVLTLPVFVMVMLLIVQVSQLMIAAVVVHYAAYAAVRAAIVWIPADLGTPEQANCISAYAIDPEATDQTPPILDPDDPNYGPGEGGLRFVVAPGGPKYEKILSAAVLACMPVAPSRGLGVGDNGATSMVSGPLQTAYEAIATRSGGRAAIPARLANKLAYAAQNTTVEVRFFHKNREPPLVTYWIEHDPGEFYFNQLGWQDPITVTVKHDLALLPGPGRLLARRASDNDEVSREIQRQGNVYTYRLTASATLGNEGEKSVIPYAYAP